MASCHADRSLRTTRGATALRKVASYSCTSFKNLTKSSHVVCPLAPTLQSAMGARGMSRSTTRWG
jgi:hypothetical protein